MKISIVIPTFNRATLLVEAIDSVLRQTHTDLEVIVSDNCSSDNTQQIMQRYLADPRVKYFRNEYNFGMVGNWRLSIFERSTAEWFVLMSDDDYFIDEEYIADVSKLIEENPTIQFVYASGYVLYQNGRMRKLEIPFEGVVSGREVFRSRDTVKPQDITLCNMVFNVCKAREQGFLRNPNNLSCDSELYLKLALLGDVGVINRPVSVYRFHAGNLVKATLTSMKYMSANLDAFVLPYIMALAIADRESAETFRRHTKLDRMVSVALLKAKCFGGDAFSKLLLKLENDAPGLLSSVVNSTGFKIKLACARLAGPVIAWRLRLVE